MAMEKAGATIIASCHFGSYQGTAWFLVKYNGEYGWVSLNYGSCSGCDSFQAEFEDYTRDYSDSDYASFGARYLEGLLTPLEALGRVSEDRCWDMEAGEAIKFVTESNKLIPQEHNYSI